MDIGVTAAFNSWRKAVMRAYARDLWKVGRSSWVCIRFWGWEKVWVSMEMGASGSGGISTAGDGDDRDCACDNDGVEVMIVPGIGLGVSRMIAMSVSLRLRAFRECRYLMLCSSHVCIFGDAVQLLPLVS